VGVYSANVTPSRDPLGFVMMAYPWKQPGTELEHEQGSSAISVVCDWRLLAAYSEQAITIARCPLEWRIQDDVRTWGIEATPSLARARYGRR
jgi:hypothetical protein